jgi:hypothetical protein
MTTSERVAIEYEFCTFTTWRDFSIGTRLRAESGWRLQGWVRHDFYHDDGRVKSWQVEFNAVFERSAR